METSVPNADFYRRLYEEIGTETPLRFDCGRLCSHACCAVTPDLPGMYLFPGEEALYEGVPGFSVTPSTLAGYGPVALLSCNGACDRERRPLACRIFPLAARATADGLRLRMDRRGFGLCPLCAEGKAGLCEPFVTAVERALQALWREPEGERFLRALSAQLDAFERQGL